MLALVLAASADDLSWTCTELTSVADALPWKAAEVGAAADAWDALYAYVDTSCTLVACDDGTFDASFCWGIDCTTSGGATVQYSYRYYADGTGNEDVDERLEVVPPAEAGETWTWVAAEKSAYVSFNGASTTHDFTWTGALAEGRVEDGTLRAVDVYTTDWGSVVGRHRSWSDPDCAWDYRLWDYSADDWVLYDIEVDGVTVEVDLDYRCGYGTYLGWFGTFDGASVGEVDDATWEAISCVDGDGDGECVEWGDCDDADPARSACGSETPYDGIDQDCSGADLTDQDHDGYDGVEGGGSDCDDADRTVNPSAYDIAYDGIDQDCSGSDLTDRDGDGFDAEDVGGDDCADTYADRHPGAPEIGCDGIDQDCNGLDAKCVSRPVFAPGTRPGPVR